jgi:malate dehydrogenase
MQGEYGLQDIFFGAPVMLGRKGVEKVIEYKLDPDEQAALEKSAAAVTDTIKALHNLVKI